MTISLKEVSGKRELRRPFTVWKTGISLSLALIFALGFEDIFRSSRLLLARLAKPNQFGSSDISKTAATFRRFHTTLLVFNGTNFEVYNLDNENQQYPKDDPPHCGRCGKIVPLLIYALMELDPDRFERGQPVFQVLFSAGDSATSECVNPGKCDAATFAPLMLFGSEPNDIQIMPQVKGFPNWFYISCLYEYKLKGTNQCHWAESVIKAESAPNFDSLIPTIIWRGSDFCFLPDYEKFHFKGPDSINLKDNATREEAVKALMENWNQLPPRWRGVALTAQAELMNQTWIDTKFTGSFGVGRQRKFEKRGVQVSTTETMTPEEMGQYKYQIDFGGGGGTSWRGTLTKLSLPGVLFHHETPSMDWFYDEMIPWVHYVPVYWHLGDLRQKYQWAQTHQESVKEIARRSTELFEYFMSEPYMNRVYNTLFVDYLSEVLKAHVTHNSTWTEVKTQYEADGFKLDRVVACNENECITDTPTGRKETRSFVPTMKQSGTVGKEGTVSAI